MKELHNHIFSNTACISKETMLKSINKQLTKKELYAVEKHLLDCELCSDAFAGLKYTQNSSLLFAIDNAIDKKAGGRITKTQVLRNGMVAASVLILFVGTYFVVNSFHQVIDTAPNLAVNKNQINEFNAVSDPVPIPEKNSAVKAVDRALNKKSTEELAKELEVETPPNFIEASPPSVGIETTEMNREVQDEAIEEFEEFEEEEEEEEFTVDGLVEDAPLEESNMALISSRSIALEALEKNKKQVNNTNSGARISEGGGRVAEIPLMAIASNAASKDKDEKKDHLLVIQGYKVVDYREAYQEQYERRMSVSYVSESVSAGFESKADKNLASKETKASTVEITYQDALGKAMRLFKNKQYRDALQEFDNISAKHHEEVNAQFYAGLCWFHLDQYASALKKFNLVLKNNNTEFNEETNWYKALTLFNMENIPAAKKLLKKMVKQNGFYSVKASEKLKEL